MNFFSAQLTFDGNLFSRYVAILFFVDITILGRSDWTVKKLPKKTLKVKRPLGAVPQAYDLIIFRNFPERLGNFIFCSNKFDI